MHHSKKAGWIFALLLLQACSTAAPDKKDNKFEQEMAQSDLHDIMTDRITDSVARMELLLIDHSRTEQELDVERRREAVIIAGAAAELQHSADMVLALQPKLAIEPDRAPKFVGLVHQLKSQAKELEGLARDNQFRALKPAHEAMKTTCTACHTQFRGY